MTDGPRRRALQNIYYISTVCLTSSGTSSIHVERLQISGASRRQNESFEIVVKLLAIFNAQFKVKESFKLLLAIKVQTTTCACVCAYAYAYACVASEDRA